MEEARAGLLSCRARERIRMKLPIVCGLLLGVRSGIVELEYDCPNCGKTHRGDFPESIMPPIILRSHECGTPVQMHRMIESNSE
jgi:hypothetical protein